MGFSVHRGGKLARDGGRVRAYAWAELADPATPANNVPGAEPVDGDGNLSKTALRNKKKRGNKK